MLVNTIVPIWQFINADHMCDIWLPGQQPAEDDKRQRTLRRISWWVTCLLSTDDLTPSDAAMALIPVTTLQRQARKRAVSFPLSLFYLDPGTPAV